MHNKIYMVTGANVGIGQATTLGLVKMGATIGMVCRGGDRGRATMLKIKREWD